MVIRVSYFAIYQELMQKDSEEVQVRDGLSVGQLFQMLTSHLKNQERLLTSTVFAINSDYAAVETVLKDGDEVVFIPPVSGG